MNTDTPERGLTRFYGGLSLEQRRFARFLVVGGVNTLVGYGLFWIALAVMPTTFTALCLSTATAVLFNFFTTGSFVFGTRDLRRLIPFYGVYAIVFGYNALGLALLEGAGVDPRLGALILLPGAVIGAYGLNRRVVFSTPA